MIPLQYNFEIDGHTIEVYAAIRAPQPRDDADMIGVMLRARAPLVPGTPHGRSLVLNVSRYGLAARGMSLSKPYWREWVEMGGGMAVTNAPTPPEDLGETPQVVDGVSWVGLDGKPPVTLVMDIGSWAVALGTGQAYRRVRPHIEKLAEGVADELAADIRLAAEVADLPTIN